MGVVDKIALWLLIIGGLNWGLVGLFEFDLVAAIFGPLSLFTFWSEFQQSGLFMLNFCLKTNRLKNKKNP